MSSLCINAAEPWYITPPPTPPPFLRPRDQSLRVPILPEKRSKKVNATGTDAETLLGRLHGRHMLRSPRWRYCRRLYRNKSWVGVSLLDLDRPFWILLHRLCSLGARDAFS
jgi:hypothetical protein